jgi:hypothetical protein
MLARIKPSALYIIVNACSRAQGHSLDLDGRLCASFGEKARGLEFPKGANAVLMSACENEELFADVFASEIKVWRP